MHPMDSLFSKQSEEIWQDVDIDLNAYSSDFRIQTTDKDREPSTLSQSGITEQLRHACTRLAMTAIYPAQSRLLSLLNTSYSPTHLDKIRKSSLQNLYLKGFIVRRVILEKNAIKYDAYAVSNHSNLNSRKWILQATGCSAPVESSIEEIAHYYLSKSDFSLLMINGPSISRSQGEATFKSLSEAQELGVRYLEDKIKAVYIALVGHSFGGAILGQSLLNHSFHSHICYLVVRQMSFSKLTEIAKSTISSVCGTLLEKLDLDLDATEVSTTLENRSIQEIIIQATHRPETPGKKEDFLTDGVIPGENCLGSELINRRTWKHKTFVGLGPVGHADPILWQTTIKLIEEYWENLNREKT